MKDLTRVIAVIGPTAAGKTEIGITLAQQTQGEVISVDSMQIYREMDVGTAKPTDEMLTQTPHHLINILLPDQPYNAGRFVEDADAIITDLRKREKSVILVGGTGLYIRALVHGIIDVPEISQGVRETVRKLAFEQGVAACYQQLQQNDPKSAKTLHPNDLSRIVRALEIVLDTGKSIRDFQADHRFKQHRYQALYIGAAWEREELYDRINRRVHIMVENGLIAETEKLLSMGYSDDLPSMNAIGYKQAVAFLQGKMTQAEMVADIQQKSRRYAKKQITWYKKDPSIHWLNKNELTAQDIQLVKSFLKRE